MTALAWQDDGRPKGPEAFAQVLFTAGSGLAGALIGAHVDSGNRALRDLYRPKSKPRALFLPLLSREHVGGAVRITW